MIYKPYYSDILIISSIFYYVTAMFDFYITMVGYAFYNNLFFQLELNPVICFLLKLGIIPIHMFIVPLVILLLSIYFRFLANEMNKEYIIKDEIIWGIGFAICLITMMGILHLLGFISWFYHGGI